MRVVGVERMGGDDESFSRSAVPGYRRDLRGAAARRGPCYACCFQLVSMGARRGLRTLFRSNCGTPLGLAAGGRRGAARATRTGSLPFPRGLCFPKSYYAASYPLIFI